MKHFDGQGSGYSDLERLTLFENGGTFPSSHRERTTSKARKIANILLSTTWQADEHPLAVIAANRRVTLVKIDSDAGETVDAYTHSDAIDLSTDVSDQCIVGSESVVDVWTPEIWQQATNGAIGQSLELLRNLNPAGVKISTANFQDGARVE